MGVDSTLFLVFLFFFLSVVLSFYLRDILNPLLVLVTPLALQYALFYFYLQPMYSLSDKTNLLLIITISSFAFGFLWIFFSPTIKSRISIEDNIKESDNDFFRVKKLFLFLGVLGFLMGLLTAFRFGLSGPKGFFFNLRYSNTITNENTGGIGHYLMLFLKIVSLSMIVFRKSWNIDKKTILVLTILMLSSATFTMARTNLLMTVASVLGVYILSNRYIYNKKVSKKLLLFTVIGFFLLTYLFAVGTQKTSSNSNIFFNYIAYPITAFDIWVSDYPFKANGFFTFAFFNKMLSLFGLVDYSTITIGEYVNIPKNGFRTFTLMSAPYLDFKTGGLIIVFIVLGMIFGYMYKRVRYGRPYWTIFYSIMLYPLIIAFFEYQFNLSTYFYYAIIMIVVYLWSKVVRHFRGFFDQIEMKLNDKS